MRISTAVIHNRNRCVDDGQKISQADSLRCLSELDATLHTQHYVLGDAVKDYERIYKLNQCEKGWFTLKKLEDETEKRYCEKCDKCVHWCNTEADLRKAVANKWCIATENRLVYSSSHPQSIDFKPEKQMYIGEIENSNYVPVICVGEVSAPYLVGEDISELNSDDFEEL